MLHEISRLTGLWVMHRNDPNTSPVTNEVLRKAAARFWGHDRAWDLMTHEGKAHAAVKIMDRTFAKFNYTEPVQTVFMNPDVLVPGPGDQVLARKGMTLGKEAFAAMRREFYQLRGWDPDTGVQPPDILGEMDQ
jgi:hypothetical protein